jgi:hypothetical protein
MATIPAERFVTACEQLTSVARLGRAPSATPPDSKYPHQISPSTGTNRRLPGL